MNVRECIKCGQPFSAKENICPNCKTNQQACVDC